MEVIINGKKASLRHYLNRGIGPLWVDDKKMFPLYTQIVYDTKSTKFKAFISLEFKGPAMVLFEEGQEELIRAQDMNEIDLKVWEADKLVLQILEYEIFKNGDKFTLKGFGKRLDVYGQRINELMYQVAPTSQDAKTATLILSNLQEWPMVYEWIFSDCRSLVEAQLEKSIREFDHHPNEFISHLKHKILKTIDLIIEDKLSM